MIHDDLLTSNITFIAGEGRLPLEIIEHYYSHATNKSNLQIIGYKGYNYDALHGYPMTMVSLGSLKQLIQAMTNHNTKYFFMAGSIKRPSFHDIALDSLGYRVLAKAPLAFMKGDDTLLKIYSDAISHYSHASLISTHNILPHAPGQAGILSKAKPSSDDYYDIKRGQDILHILGEHDIGQSIIVQHGVILGIEAIEGTQKLIERTSMLALKGKKPILVKILKHTQSTKLDIPSIGEDTIEQLYKAGFGGIALDKNAHIIYKDATIALCNKYKLFLILL